jgi:hypothetical protein
MEGNGYGLIWDTVPTFIRSDWHNPSENKIMLIGVPAETEINPYL